MPKLDFIGSGYLGRSSNVNASRCINLYPEINGQDSKSVVSLVGTPGLLLYIDTLFLPIRGAHFFNNRIYFVSGDKLYSVDNAKNLTPVFDTLGNVVKLTSYDGRVSFSDNGMPYVNGVGYGQLAFVDGQNVYIYNVVTNVLSNPPSPIPAKSIDFIAGFFMVDMGGGGEFCISGTDGTTWNGLAFGVANAYPDNLMSIINNHNEAWLIGEYSTEIWQPDGSANYLPFSRVAVVDYGTPAFSSVAKGNNTVFWMVSQRDGETGEVLGVGMANGYGVDIISPPAINYQISQYAVVADAWGYCFTESGHEFYRLTFPTANATWQYDATTKMWCEVSYYAGSPYIVGRHLANSYVYAWGKHFIGSYLDGKIYEMSSKYLDDNGTPIASVRICSPMDDKNNNENVFVSKFELECEAGTGQNNFRSGEIELVGVVSQTIAGSGIQRGVFLNGYYWFGGFFTSLLYQIDPDNKTIVSNLCCTYKTVT